jgi:hypothetical protein
VSIVAVSAVGAAALWSNAADHRDGPIFGTNGDANVENRRQDINDIYIFRSPVTATNTVIVVTISPFTNSPTSTIGTPAEFSEDVTLDIKIDRNGNAQEDITYRVTFGPAAGGVQSVRLRRGGKTVATGNTGVNLPVRGGGMFRAGNFDDPFFFDAIGFRDFLDGLIPSPNRGMDATNFFGPNANTLAVVLEVPTESLLKRNMTSLGVWARTVVDGGQVDRMGFPAINTAITPPVPRDNPLDAEDMARERRNAFNVNVRPRRDRDLFGNDYIGVLMNFYGRNQADSQGLTNFLLPDILPYDTAAAEGFPNGRRLRDDVIDIEYGLLTNGAVTTDSVPDDNGMRITDGNMGTTAAFPYLGAPN